MNVSPDNTHTYYDGFSIKRVGDQWVANHDYFNYGSISGNTVRGVMQMIDDFYQDEPQEDEGGLQDDY